MENLSSQNKPLLLEAMGLLQHEQQQTDRAYLQNSKIEEKKTSTSKPQASNLRTTIDSLPKETLTSWSKRKILPKIQFNKRAQKEISAFYTSQKNTSRMKRPKPSVPSDELEERQITIFGFPFQDVRNIIEKFRLYGLILNVYLEHNALNVTYSDAICACRAVGEDAKWWHNQKGEAFLLCVKYTANIRPNPASSSNQQQLTAEALTNPDSKELQIKPDISYTAFVWRILCTGW